MALWVVAPVEEATRTHRGQEVNTRADGCTPPTGMRGAANPFCLDSCALPTVGGLYTCYCVSCGSPVWAVGGPSLHGTVTLKSC